MQGKFVCSKDQHLSTAPCVTLQSLADNFTFRLVLFNNTNGQRLFSSALLALQLSQGYPSHPPTYSVMSIRSQYSGLTCLAVNQDSMYAVVEGAQSIGYGGPLLCIDQDRSPITEVANSTWTVPSTAPVSYFHINSSQKRLPPGHETCSLTIHIPWIV